VDERCKKAIRDLETECDFSGETTFIEDLIIKKSELEKSDIDFLEKGKLRGEIITRMDDFMRNYIEKAYAKKINNPLPTLRDVLKEYIPQGMALYNSNGFIIEI